MSQYEETKKEIIEYYKTNKENGAPTIARIFNVFRHFVDGIITEHLSTLKNSMQ